jgi:hypothetical protein
MKPKIRRVWFTDTIFAGKFCVQRGGKCTDALKYFEKKMKEKYEFAKPSDNCGGYFLKAADCKAVFIWLQWGAGTGAITHEVCHATLALLNECGIQHTVETDEVFAYYTGFLAKFIVKALWC